MRGALEVWSDDGSLWYVKYIYPEHGGGVTVLFYTEADAHECARWMRSLREVPGRTELYDTARRWMAEQAVRRA